MLIIHFMLSEFALIFKLIGPLKTWSRISSFITPRISLIVKTWALVVYSFQSLKLKNLYMSFRVTSKTFDLIIFQ